MSNAETSPTVLSPQTVTNTIGIRIANGVFYLMLALVVLIVGSVILAKLAQQQQIVLLPWSSPIITFVAEGAEALSMASGVLSLFALAVSTVVLRQVVKVEIDRTPAGLRKDLLDTQNNLRNANDVLEGLRVEAARWESDAKQFAQSNEAHRTQAERLGVELTQLRHAAETTIRDLNAQVTGLRTQANAALAKSEERKLVLMQLRTILAGVTSLSADLQQTRADIERAVGDAPSSQT